MNIEAYFRFRKCLFESSLGSGDFIDIQKG